MVRLSGPILVVMVLGASLFLSLQLWGQGAAAHNGDSLEDCVYIFNYTFLDGPPPPLPNIADPPKGMHLIEYASLETLPNGTLVKFEFEDLYGLTDPTFPYGEISSTPLGIVQLRKISQHEQRIWIRDCLFLNYKDPIKLFPRGGVADLRRNELVTSRCVRLINPDSPLFGPSVGPPGGRGILVQLLDDGHCSDLGPLPEPNPNADRIRGDGNCDGDVKLNDVWAALETIANIHLARCVDEVDANSDGSISGADALLIADFVRALEASFPRRLDHLVTGPKIGDVVRISRELKGQGNFRGAGVVVPEINAEMHVSIDLNSRVVYGLFTAQGSTNSIVDASSGVSERRSVRGSASSFAGPTSGRSSSSCSAQR